MKIYASPIKFYIDDIQVTTLPNGYVGIPYGTEVNPGYVTVSAGGGAGSCIVTSLGDPLPSGISADEIDEKLKFYGTPQQVEVVHGRIKATDSDGNIVYLNY